MLKQFTRWYICFLLFATPFLLKSQGLPPGWDYTITSTNHIISVPLSATPTINGIPIEPGDYIGVFFIDDGIDVCGGAAEWLGDQNIAVVAYGDDNLTTEKDGFYVNEIINFKIYSWQQETEFDAEAVWDPDMPNNQGTFFPNGLSALLSLSLPDAYFIVCNASPETICYGDTSQLTAEATGGAGVYSYSWTSEPPGFFSDEQNPTVIPENTTSYIVTATSTDTLMTDTTYVNVVPPPMVNAGDDQVICETQTVQLSGYASSYISLLWQTSGDGNFANDTLPETEYYPGPGDIQIGMVSVSIAATPYPPCENEATDQALIFIQKAPYADAGPDDTTCSGNNYLTSGISENAYYTLWQSGGDGNFEFPGLLNTNYYPGESDIQSGEVELILLAYPKSPCIEVISDTLVLIIESTPQVSAGLNQTIPYGTTTQLDGSASGGSGSYIYEWTPENMVTDPTIADPFTVQLEETTIFTLRITDVETTCMAEDETIIYIVGGPLSVNVSAIPEVLCFGTEVQLQAIPSGGSGNYSFLWWSEPEGFTATIEDPVDTPENTIEYFVEINDGFNTASDSIEVTVHPIPEVSITSYPDDTVCHNESITLTAIANNASTYYWEPGGFNTESITIDTSFVGIGSELFTVTISDSNNCMNTANEYIVFYNCVVIPESKPEKMIIAFPNPVNTQLNIKSSEVIKAMKLYSLNGTVLLDQFFSQPVRSYTLSCSGLHRGIYLLMITTSSKAQTIKIIKQ